MRSPDHSATRRGEFYMQQTARNETRFPIRMSLRAPRGLPEAIEFAARQQHTVPAEYCRRAILGALEADGLHLAPDGTVETRGGEEAA